MTAGHEDAEGDVPPLPRVDPVESVEALARTLRPVMRAVAAAVGRHCEVVLHDLSSRDMTRSIVAIENGHVSGRGVGGPSTNLGLEVIHAEETDHDAFGYRGRTADGRELMCSSVYYRDRSGAVVAALCINIDLTPLQTVQGILGSLLPVADASPGREVVAPDIHAVLDDLLEQAIAHAGAPVALLDKPGRLAVFRYLEDRGAFAVKKSVERTARRLAISKVTAYSYLEEIRRREQAPTEPGDVTET